MMQTYEHCWRIMKVEEHFWRVKAKEYCWRIVEAQEHFWMLVKVEDHFWRMVKLNELTNAILFPIQSISTTFIFQLKLKLEQPHHITHYKQKGVNQSASTLKKFPL